MFIEGSKPGISALGIGFDINTAYQYFWHGNCNTLDQSQPETDFERGGNV